MIENRFRSRYHSESSGLLILAHRGDSFHAPENTLEAALLGHASGAEGWELDVRLTSDLVPVVLHDESLVRTTDVANRYPGDPRADRGYRVGEFSLREIRSLDAGSWFLDRPGTARSAAGFGSIDQICQADRDHYRSGNVRIPTLAEALELTLSLDWLVNVEIKPSSEDRETIGPAILRLIRGSSAIDRVVVSSFDLAIVADLASSEPALATAALVDGLIDRPAVEWLGSTGADALHVSFRSILADAELRPETSWFRGVPLLAYTVNEAGPSGLADRLQKAGVLGFFTDDPAVFARGPSFNRS